MKIVNKVNGKNLSLKTNEISASEINSLSNPLSIKILKTLRDEPMYPKQIAKKLKIHEQNIYYYMRKFEKAGIVRVVKQENINGTIAKFYALTSDSFFFKIGDFKESFKDDERESGFFKNFIQDGDLNALVIVGSPDPHGPMKARSRDGYFGMDLALFLGTFLSGVSDLKVRLDTEVNDKELKENNLIVIGGPIVNKISEMIGRDMEVYYDENKKGFYSMISKKLYVHDDIGVINKFKSPFNKDKEIIFIAGVRNSGTKSAIIAFIKHLKEIEKGNNLNHKVFSKVVEGIDFNSDGVVDDVEFLE